MPQPTDEAGRHLSWSLSDAYADQLGSALLPLLASIPAGVLVFLPSYALLERLERRWRASGAWAALALHKPCLLSEASARPPAETKKVVREMVAQHKASVLAGRGACLLAVYRGALSEGISFDDDDCRGVLCVGVPLPHKAEPRIQAKAQHNTALAAQQRAARGVRVLDGERYYEQLGWRPLSQALGRAVRHPRDYGAIVLLDERHSHADAQQHLPPWIVRHGLRTQAAPVPTEAPEAAAALRAFFAQAEAHYPRQR